MTDIKELALRVAKEIALPAKHITFANEIGYGFDGDELADFAQRFLASYLAEQEPVAWLFDTEEDGKYWYDRYQPCGRPVFAAPLPEHAPMSQVFMVTNRTSCVVFATAEQAHQYIASFSGSIGGGMSITSVPVISEPAPLPEQGCAECGKKASVGWALYCVKCAKQIKDAPLLEDVLEMVERLRVVWGTQLGKEAADMLERLAAGEQK